MLETPIVESTTMVVEEGTTMIVNQKKNGFSSMEKKKRGSLVYLLQQATPHTGEVPEITWKISKLRMGQKRQSRERGRKEVLKKRGGQGHVDTADGHSEELVS